MPTPARVPLRQPFLFSPDKNRESAGLGINRVGVTRYGSGIPSGGRRYRSRNSSSRSAGTSWRGRSARWAWGRGLGVEHGRVGFDAPSAPRAAPPARRCTRSRHRPAHRAPGEGSRRGAGAPALQRSDPPPTRAGAHGQRGIRRGRRVRSDRVPAEGSERDRGDGERSRRRVRGAGGADREGAGRSIRGGGGRPAPDRAHRWAAGPSGRRIIALGGCATSGGQPCPCDHPASLAPRSRAHDPQVLAGSDHGGGPGRGGEHRAADAELPGRLRPWTCQRDRVGWRGDGEDHAARHPLGRPSPTPSD